MFAFLFGHMIPKADRHSAGLRTVAMVSGIYAALAAHRGFLDPDASDGVRAGAKKNAVRQLRHCFGPSHACSSALHHPPAPLSMRYFLTWWPP